MHNSLEMEQKKVLVMIPAYNEASMIRRLVKEIKSFHPNYPILVINDGSTDDTRSEAEAAGARVVSLPCNLGIGGAVQTGFKIARAEDYDVAVRIDGDAQHDPVHMTHLLEPILKNEIDLCTGSRFLGSNTGFKSTPIRRLGIRFFAKLLSLLTHEPLTDPTSGYFAVSKSLIRAFAESYPVDFPEPEAIQMAKRLGARIREVPVKMRKRIGGVSSIRYMSSAYYMVKVTLAILIDAMRKKA